MISLIENNFKLGLSVLKFNTLKPAENFYENLNFLKIVYGREHYYYIISKAQFLRDHSSLCMKAKCIITITNRG